MEGAPLESKDLPAPAHEHAPGGPVPETRPTPQPTARRAEGLVPHKPRPAASSSRQRSRSQSSNLQCTLGLYFFLASAFLFLLGYFLLSTRATALLAGGLLFLSMPVFWCSMVLAAVGLRQCRRRPEAYGRSRTAAIVTLTLGSTVALLFLVGLIAGARYPGGSAKKGAGFIPASTELLHFDPLNFTYQPPGSPWVQVDARRYGNSTLAFERPGPLFFQLRAQRLASGLGQTRNDLAALWKQDLQKTSISYRTVWEGEATRNGLAGWQIESAVNVQGRDCYFIEWGLISGGVGYELLTWGPAAMTPEIKQEADRMCLNFKVTGRQL